MKSLFLKYKGSTLLLISGALLFFVEIIAPNMGVESYISQGDYFPLRKLNGVSANDFSGFKLCGLLLILTAIISTCFKNKRTIRSVLFFSVLLQISTLLFIVETAPFYKIFFDSIVYGYSYMLIVILALIILGYIFLYLSPKQIR